MSRLTAMLVLLSALMASAGVNPDGSFSHDVPIDLPTFGPGPKPKLALSYSSLGGNGPVGVGWQLTGLTGISRINYTHPIRYAATDTFIGPSGRLIAMSDGSYHSENEDWLRLIAHPTVGTGPSAWTGTDAQGNTLTFGNGNTDVAWDAYGRGIRTWGLSRLTDTHGNGYGATYFVDGWQLYPSRLSTGTYFVDFTWSARTDVIVDDTQGSPLSIAKRLTGISVRSQTAGNPLIRRYDLAYEYAPDTGQSRLTSITSYGSDGATVERRRRFEWGAGTSFYTSLHSQSVPMPENGAHTLGDINGDGFADVLTTPGPGDCTLGATPHSPPQPNGFTGWGTTILSTGSCTWNAAYAWPGDFNGDGKLDYAMKPANRDDAVLVWLAAVDYTYTQSTWPVGSNGAWGAPDDTFTGDFDGDSKTDLATRSGTSYRVFLSTGGGFVTRTWGAGTTWGQPGGRFAGDFDGDGKTDLASITGSSGAYRLVVLRSLGTSFSVEQWPAGGFWNLTALTHVGDFNGDGKLDFASRSNETIAETFIHLSTGRSLETYTVPLSLGPENVLVQGDFNGDGRTDFLKGIPPGGAGTVLFSTSTSFTERFDPQAFDTSGGIVLRPLVADLDGDGISDTFSRVPFQPAKRRLRHANRDLMNNVYSGFTSATPDLQVTYLTAPQFPDAVAPHRTDCEGDTVQSVCGIAYAAPRPLVRRLLVGDGRGAQYGTTYKFENGRVLPGPVGEAANLGFQSIAAVEDATAKVTESVMWQVRPLNGLIRISRVYLPGLPPLFQPRLVESSENDGWLQYSCSDAGCVAAPGILDQPRQVRALSNSFKHYEMGALLSEDRTATQYDDYGNAVSVVRQSIRNGATLATEIATATFINQPLAARRTVGLPRSKARFSNVHGIDTAEQLFFYDGLPLGQVGAHADPTSARARNGLLTAPWEETQRTFDTAGNVLTELSPTGLTTSWVYSADRQVVTSISDVNGIIELTVDRRSGHIVRTHRGDGLDVAVDLDVWLRPTATRWLYNGTLLRKVTVESVPTGEFRRDCDWYGAGFATSLCQQRQFDALGREVQVQKLGPGRSLPTIVREYDAAGRLYRVSQPFFSGSQPQHFTTNLYDDLGRLAQTTGPDGAVTRLTYNQGTFAPGAVSKQTLINARGFATILHKDPRGSVVRVVEGSTCPTCAVEPGVTTSYRYDGDGLLTDLTKPDGTTLTFGYDARGRRIRATDPNLGVSTRSYYNVPGVPAFGQVALEERPVARGSPGQTESVAYDYDGRGRIMSRSQTAGGWVTVYSYDPTPGSAGRLLRISHRDGLLTVITTPYADVLGRQVGGSQEVTGKLPDGTAVNETHDLSFELDGMGRIASIKYPDGRIAGRQYDVWGQLERVQLNPVAVTLSAFDARGEWQQASFGNGVLWSRTFEATTGRLSGQQAVRAGSVLHQQSFSWDAQGNLGKLGDAVDPSLSSKYTYDALDRLVEATRGADTFTYQYDSGGNLVGKSTLNGAGGVVHLTRALVAGTNRLADDGQGTSLVYGPAGGVVTRGGYEYDYGADLLLNRVRFAGAEVEASGYDGREQRVVHVEHRPNGDVVSVYLGAHFTARTRYVSGKPVAAQQLHELWEGGTHVATMVTGDRDLDSPGPQGPSSRYYVGDHLGSTAIVTDDAGAVVTRAVFAPFGEIDRQRSSLGIETRLFTGQQYDLSSNLVAMGARMYDPQLGGFLSPDSFIADPTSSLDLLSYSYARGNPLKYVDPSGHFVWMPVIIGAAIGFVVGAVLGGTSFGAVTDPGKWWDYDYLSANWSWKRAIAGAIIGAALGAGYGALSSLPGSVLGVKSTVLAKEMVKGAAFETLSSIARGADGAGDIIKAIAAGAGLGFMSKTGFFGMAEQGLGKGKGWMGLLWYSGVRAADSFVYSVMQRTMFDPEYPMEIALPFVTFSWHADGASTWRLQVLTIVRVVVCGFYDAPGATDLTDFTVNHTEHTMQRVGAITGERGLTLFAFNLYSMVSTGFEIDAASFADLVRTPMLLAVGAAAGVAKLTNDYAWDTKLGCNGGKDTEKCFH